MLKARERHAMYKWDACRTQTGSFGGTGRKERRNEGTNGVLVGAVLLPLSFFPSPFLLPELDQRQNNAKESLDIAKGGRLMIAVFKRKSASPQGTDLIPRESTSAPRLFFRCRVSRRSKYHPLKHLHLCLFISLVLENCNQSLISKL